jgi:hypothetical protein
MMQILKPVDVPWKISPSVPYLEIVDASSDRRAFATFIGFFKTAAPEAAAESIVARVPAPDTFAASADWRGARHRLVRIEFDGCTNVRRTPAFSDSELVDEANYDWSMVSSGLRDEESVEECVQRVHDRWMSTGLCPDPAMYEVINSPWLDVLGRSGTARHYLLLGHDDYVEVVATGWRWQPGQPVL